MYEIAKDFAGPASAAFVGLIALWITWSWNAKQASIARDKLKFDLFERRYAIYFATKRMLELALKVNSEGQWNNREDAEEYYKLNPTVNECIFFFGADAQSSFFELAGDAGGYVLAKRYNHSLEDGEEKSARVAAQLDAYTRLDKKYRDLPRRFLSELKFDQLTN